MRVWMVMMDANVTPCPLIGASVPASKCSDKGGTHFLLPVVSLQEVGSGVLAMGLRELCSIEQNRQGTIWGVSCRLQIKLFDLICHCMYTIYRSWFGCYVILILRGLPNPSYIYRIELIVSACACMYHQ